MRPPYNLVSSCNNLLWDDVFEDWFCGSSRFCYRLSCDCPLVEALTMDVITNRIELNDVPSSLRDVVRKRVESNSSSVELYFF